jgi:hypothetical protein
MRNIVISVAAIATLVAVFFLGRCSNNWRAEVLHNADGILAYQHYYEVAEKIISEDSITDDDVLNYVAAKKQLDDFKNDIIMTWPEICDQRDRLSDAIRCYADHHQDCDDPDDNIYNFVMEFGTDPDNLGNWS